MVRAWQANGEKGRDRWPNRNSRSRPRRRRRTARSSSRDLVAFPAKEGGPIDRAAVILARRQGPVPDPADRYLLVLMDLAHGRELGRCALGPSQPHRSRLAASPDGKHIAVADADRQRVLVYATADLEAGQDDAIPQVLRGVGAGFRAVSFRKKGDAPGLLLEEDGGARLVFDFDAPRLLDDDGSWMKDSPDVKGWDVRPGKKDGKLVVAVSGPGYLEKTVEIGEKYAVTAGALLPPGKGRPFGPVLALGCLDEYGDPLLALYDVDSGVLVRRLAGHVAAVRGLAFSGDGRLLASAGDDQTVCLWSMTSLDQVLGKAGALPGVAVVARGKAVEVADAPAGGPLRKGAVIEGVVEGNKLRPVTTALEFYTALFDRRPKDDVVLRVRAAGAGQSQDLTLTVGQGTDERKPLLNLFVTRDGWGAKRDWIAWTSRGQYDASARGAEKYLGWHFNPEKRDEPVDFAAADQYRKVYASPGLLKYVLQFANTARAVDEWKKAPPPEMEVMIDGVDPGPRGPRVGGLPLVRTRALTLRAAVPPDFPLERVSALTWRLDDGDWRPLGQEPQRASSADLSEGRWGRGPHVVAVRMETDGGRRARGADRRLPLPARGAGGRIPRGVAGEEFSRPVGAGPRKDDKGEGFRAGGPRRPGGRRRGADRDAAGRRGPGGGGGAGRPPRIPSARGAKYPRNPRDQPGGLAAGQGSGGQGDDRPPRARELLRGAPRPDGGPSRGRAGGRRGACGPGADGRAGRDVGPAGPRHGPGRWRGGPGRGEARRQGARRLRGGQGQAV